MNVFRFSSKPPPPPPPPKKDTLKESILKKTLVLPSYTMQSHRHQLRQTEHQSSLSLFFKPPRVRGQTSRSLWRHRSRMTLPPGDDLGDCKLECFGSLKRKGRINSFPSYIHSFGKKIIIKIIVLVVQCIETSRIEQKSFYCKQKIRDSTESKIMMQINILQKLTSSTCKLSAQFDPGKSLIYSH